MIFMLLFLLLFIVTGESFETNDFSSSQCPVQAVDEGTLLINEASQINHDDFNNNDNMMGGW